jgi:flavin-dependent dehydrogenase
MQNADSIAVIGGGPAGALAASQLASAGANVLLFDEKLAWEKPCGGGITHKALLHFPFLAETRHDRNWIEQCQLTSPAGKHALFNLEQPAAIFSRRVLNGLILDRAQRAGALIRKEHVLSINGEAGNWKIQTTARDHEASFVVLAAGARSRLRGLFAEPFSPNDLMITAGYFIPGTSQQMKVEFVRGLHGYIWIFPRLDHFSAGICAKFSDCTTRRLRRMLDESLAKAGLATDRAQFYAHILPSLRARTFRSSPFCGDGWAMIGDTAGFVDPVTGEGLYYALRSGELLSDALLSDQPASYAARVREDFLPELELAAAMSSRFFKGTWRGQPLIDCMVDLIESSATLQAMMRDLFSGMQGYLDLRRRLFLALPKVLAESLANALQLKDREAEELSAAPEAA